MEMGNFWFYAWLSGSNEGIRKDFFFIESVDFNSQATEKASDTTDKIYIRKIVNKHLSLDGAISLSSMNIKCVN
jgi:hypothetical protein